MYRKPIKKKQYTRKFKKAKKAKNYSSGISRGGTRL